MRRYPADYNPILDYYEKIQSGEDVVSQKIRRTYEKIVHDINAGAGEYYYSPERANHVIEFAENYCRLIQGDTSLVRLELWEKAMLATIFGFVDMAGRRKYRESILIIGKKNGKSLLASIVGLYLLLADGEAGPEVYAIATKRDQAKKVWLVAKQMVRKSPVLRRRVRSLVSELACDENDGFFRPLASDQDTLDGLNVQGVVMDEIHQWKNGRALYNIMADGVTAREQPLIFITTTAGFIREDIYDEKYAEAEMVIDGYFNETEGAYRDERLIAFVYELDKKEEWTDPGCWKKANPGLGTIKKYDQLAEKVEKAKKNPLLVRNLLCKEFNLPQTDTSCWLDFDALNNREIFDANELKPRYGVGGVDLSATTDLTAAVVIFQVPGDPRIYVLPMFWMPEDLVEQKIQNDNTPYDKWIDVGLVRTCPGNRIISRFVTDWFKEIRDVYDICVPWIGYDRWMVGDWLDEMRGEFGPNSMIEVAQGFKTLSTPMKALGADLSAKRIIYGNNPILKMCLANTSIKEDTNGNIMPAKPPHSSTRRIDGLSALLDAYVVWTDKNMDYHSLI